MRRDEIGMRRDCLVVWVEVGNGRRGKGRREEKIV